MKSTTAEAKALDPRPYIPLPWEAFYEFTRLIWLGFLATLEARPRPTSFLGSILFPTTPHRQSAFQSAARASEVEPYLRPDRNHQLWVLARFALACAFASLSPQLSQW
jgi:hypothetical protein